MSTVVSYAIDESDKSDGDFDKFWVLAFRALVDIYFSIEAEPKTVLIPVRGNKTAPLPPDCVQWTKIAIMGSDGVPVSLRVNRTLSKYKSINPDRISAIAPNADTSLGALVPYLNFFINGSYQVLFGVAAGLVVPGECNVDEKNKIIVLNPDFQYPDVLLEYISSPEQDADYQIDIFSQEAVVAFIKWKAKLGSEQDYYNRKREARRKMEPVRNQTIQDAIRSGSKYCIKA